MPFCPSCGREYPDKVKTCPDCDKRLVDIFSEDHFEGNIVEVYSSFSVAEAGLVKELLVGEGIFAVLSNEMSGALFSGVPSSAGEVRILTSEIDAERAKEMIDIYIEGSMDKGSDYLICDNCGAEVTENERFCPFCGEPFED